MAKFKKGSDYEKKLVAAAELLMKYMDASVGYFVVKNDMPKAKSMADISALQLLTKIIEKDFMQDDN